MLCLQAQVKWVVGLNALFLNCILILLSWANFLMGFSVMPMANWVWLLVWLCLDHPVKHLLCKGGWAFSLVFCVWIPGWGFSWSPTILGPLHQQFWGIKLKSWIWFVPVYAPWPIVPLLLDKLDWHWVDMGPGCVGLYIFSHCAKNNIFCLIANHSNMAMHSPSISGQNACNYCQ